MPKDQLQILLERVDEHFAHKEHVSSEVLRDTENKNIVAHNKLNKSVEKIQEQLKQISIQNMELIELLKLWRNAKGFAKIVKWISIFIIGLGATIATVKNLPVQWK